MPDICFVIIDHNLLVRDDKPVVKCLVNVIIHLNQCNRPVLCLQQKGDKV